VHVRTWDGWAYVATVIDLYSRTIAGYAIADHMRTSLVTDALDMALKNRTPAPGVIFHSDRGTPIHIERFR
jgi:putative transposase